LRAGRGDTLARWLAALPNAIREGRPHLQVLLAEIHRQAGRFIEALEAAERACKVCSPFKKSDPALMARALVMRAAGRFAQGRYADSRADCEEAIHRAPEDADDVHLQARFILAACMQALAGPEAAVPSLQGVEEHATRRRDLWALARLHYLRSKLAIARADYVEAEREASMALLRAQEDGDEVDAINSRLNLGMVKRVTGRLRAAREDLEAARTQAEAAGYALGGAYALSNLADLELDEGKHTAALEAYQQVESLAKQVDEAQLHAYARSGMGYALTLAGQPKEAVRLLYPLLDKCKVEKRVMDWLVCALPAGFALLRAERALDARDVLMQASVHAEDHAATDELARAQLLLVAAQLALKLPKKAEKALQAALDAAARTGGDFSLASEARRLPEVWPLLAASTHPLAAIVHDKLSAASREARLESEPALPETEASIRAFALGDERVLVGMERITRWRMPRARELLFFLLERGEPVRKETVLDALWPEKQPEVAENAFRQARFQLQRALGRPCLAQQDGRWSLTIDVWLDVREFERLADEGERLAEAGELAAAATMLRQALTYYAGPYLADTYRDWADERRASASRRNLACLERLADVEQRRGRASSAAQVYYQILDIEPHRESAHRGLVVYFAGRGEPAAALDHLRRCAAILQRDLGVAPSPKTLALAQAILQRIQAGAQSFAEAQAKPQRAERTAGVSMGASNAESAKSAGLRADNESLKDRTEERRGRTRR
jgi:DNA-binding SARP family transcriptional activator